jgi:sulfate permease, SulP family
VLEVATPRPGIKWFVVDGGPINVIESTGAAMLEALAGDLRARGIRLGFANLRTEVQGLLEHSGVKAALLVLMVYSIFVMTLYLLTPQAR